MSVITELDAGAEDGTGEVIQVWSPPATAEVPLPRLKEKKKKKKKAHNQACRHWPHLYNMC